MTAEPETLHDVTPVTGTLPGEPVPYHLRSGEGVRYELDGLLWTVIARGSDTGGLFDAAYVSGGRGSGVGFHAHAAHQRSFVVVKGSVRVWLAGQSRVLVPGDSFTVPAATPLAYRMLAHHTRLLTWSAPAGGVGYVERLGERVESHVHFARPRRETTVAERAEAGLEFGIGFPSLEEVAATDDWDAALPQGVEPYFLRAGEGERLAIDHGVNHFLSRGANTEHRYFAVLTQGRHSRYFGRHYHRQHTENFVCLAGRVWVHANGQDILLTEGDFVHAPAGTIHTFAFDAHHTEMLGILTPDVFEPFFDRLGVPTDDHVYADDPSLALVEPPSPEVLRRWQAELDLVLVGPPPPDPS